MTSKSTTVSAAIADWVTRTSYESLPSHIKAESKKALINSIGTGIGAFPLEDAKRAIDYAIAQKSTGPATVLASGAKLPTGLAAFVNGVLLNNLGQEETHLRSGTHPAETTLPVVLALAEQLGSSGKEVLGALAIGIETAIAVSRMALVPAVKYDRCEAPAVYGTIGAAAAASKLVGLNATATAHALGLAANFAAGLSECIRVGTDEYHFIVALASQHAELAASLAQRGAISAPTSFEGEGGFYHLFGGVSRKELAGYDAAADITRRLGHEWGLPELIYKPYPVNYFNQVFADGALELRNKHGLKASDITAIRLTVGPLASTSGAMVDPPYRTRGSVLGSTRFCAASILARGTLNLADTLDLDAADIRALVDRTTTIPDDGLTTARIQVTAKGKEYAFDGEREGRDYCLGEEEIRGIFRTATDGVLPSAQVDKLLSLLSGVENAKDIRAIMSASVAGGK
jgi:2-methylcitrate dehydratase PrpD